jgi:DNA excision repair protein ERCC-2
MIFLGDIAISIKKTDAAKLQDEYSKLVEGLQDNSDEQSAEDAYITSPGVYYHTQPIIDTY